MSCNFRQLRYSFVISLRNSGPSQLLQAITVIPDLCQTDTFAFIIHLANVGIVGLGGHVRRRKRAAISSVGGEVGPIHERSLVLGVPRNLMDDGLASRSNILFEIDRPVIPFLDSRHFLERLCLADKRAILDD
jgi:hypothetical protein